jgi:hypothetical protein
MIAITTNNSISVNADVARRILCLGGECGVGMVTHRIGMGTMTVPTD